MPIRDSYPPLHPRAVAMKTLLRFGNAETCRLWKKRGELPNIPLVAITIARDYGQRDFPFRMDRIKPEDVREMFPADVPLRELASALNISPGMPSTWRKNGAGPTNGAAQLIDVIHRVGWTDDFRAAYLATQRVPVVSRKKIPADRYTREELVAIGGETRVGNWIHQNEIAPNFSAIIRIAEAEGLDLLALDLPDADIPADMVKRATYGIPAKELARQLSASNQTIWRIRTDRASAMFGVAQLVTLLHRVGYFDRLREIHGVTETPEEFELIALEDEEEQAVKNQGRFFFFGQAPRFARLHKGHRIGPMHDSYEKAMRCESTDTRIINRRNVRTLDGERYIYIDGETVALITE